MKQITVAGLCLFVCTYAHANQTTHHALANSITAHNIGSFQHTITQNAFNSFGLQNQNIFNNKKDQPNINAANMYGHAPVYGTELMYGEFNDDGTMGRSGGDTPFSKISNIWLNWQHTDNKSKFDNLSPIKNKNDLIIAGLSGNKSNIGSFIHNWGISTGYAHSKQHNNDLHTDSQGGYLSIFNGFYYKKLSINTNITTGVFDSSSDNKFGTDDYTNFWFSGAAGISYDIALDDTFVLRPVINTEYTWIKSKDYTSVSGDKINNKNFNMFELSPELQAIKHITNNWFGKLNIKYVMTFANNDNTIINNIDTLNLNNTDYFEYSISIEKTFYNTNVHATVGRQDGDIYGWFGNINIKYLF